MINTKDMMEGRFSLEEPQDYEVNPAVDKIIRKPNKETDPVPNENTAGAGGSETTGLIQTMRDDLQLRSFNGVGGTQSTDNHSGFNSENGLSMPLLPLDDTKPSPPKEGVTPPPPASKNITLGNDDKRGVASGDICEGLVITDDSNIEVAPIIRDHDDEENNVVVNNNEEILSSYLQNNSLMTPDGNIEICTENENIPEEEAQMSPLPNDKKIIKKIVQKVVKKSKRKGHPKRQTRRQKLREHNQNLKQRVTTGKKCKKEKQENAETQIERGVEEDRGIVFQTVGEEEELKEGETADRGETTNEGDITTEEEDTISSTNEEESDDDIQKDGHPGASNISVPKIKESKPKEEVNKEDDTTSTSESFTVEIDKAKFTREKTCPLGMSGHYEGHCDGELICTPGHRIMATGWKEGLAFVRRDIAIAQPEEYATFAMKPIANEKGVG